jgi:dTDP-4-amino-4,6-dideoxygalactose transaminase
MTGATPVFVDIDSSTYLMDSSKLEAKITAKTKAIVPVHLYGQMADMDEILAIGQKHRIPVLEDCAQSSGATYKNAKAGSLGFMGAFSFYPSKNLGAFGDGGAVSTNCAQTYEKLKRLRYYGQSARRYYHDEIGINSRLDDIQAAILRTQLPHLDRWNARRNEIAQAYNKGLKGLVLTPFAADNRNHVYHLYVIRVENRDQLQEQLLTRGVQTLIHYPIPAHLQKAYAFLGYKEGSLPVTENIAQRILSLPIYPHLTDAQVQTVIDAVREFCSTSPTPTVVTTPWLTQPALS